MIDPVQLAKDMLEWREKRLELDHIEGKIKEAVLEMGKTQTVGDVRASYSAGRRTFDYQQAVQDHMARNPVDLKILVAGVEAHTKTVTTVDYRAVCDAWKLEAPVVKQGTPSVDIKFV